MAQDINQVKVFGATDAQQAELDRMSITLAGLDSDSRMTTCVNGFAFAAESPVSIISSLAKCMITLSAVVGDDDLKRRVVLALRSVANTYEDAIAIMNKNELN